MTATLLVASLGDLAADLHALHQAAQDCQTQHGGAWPVIVWSASPATQPGRLIAHVDAGLAPYVHRAWPDAVLARSAPTSIGDVVVWLHATPRLCVVWCELHLGRQAGVAA